MLNFKAVEPGEGRAGGLGIPDGARHPEVVRGLPGGAKNFGSFSRIFVAGRLLGDCQKTLGEKIQPRIDALAHPPTPTIPSATSRDGHGFSQRSSTIVLLICVHRGSSAVPKTPRLLRFTPLRGLMQPSVRPGARTHRVLTRRPGFLCQQTNSIVGEGKGNPHRSPSQRDM